MNNSHAIFDGFNLHSFTMRFNDIKYLSIFLLQLKSYIPNIKFEKADDSVKINCSNRGEAWFLTLFCASLLAHRKKVKAPKAFLKHMCLLANETENDKIVDIVDNYYSDLGLNQADILKQYLD